VLTADPEVGREPPHEPAAVQPLLLVVVQLIFALVPAVIDVGLTLIWTVGIAGVVLVLTSMVPFCVTLPPAPEHVREYV
jgi:hypothetical protein